MSWKINLGKIDGEFCYLEIDGANLVLDSGHLEYPMSLDRAELEDLIGGLQAGLKHLTKGASNEKAS